MSPAERSERPRLSRRTLLALGAGTFAVAVAPSLLGLGRGRLVRRTLPLMGTIAEVAVVHPEEAFGERALDAAFAELEFVDRTMSRHSGSSDIGRLNSGGARGPVTIRPETAFVLEEALRWAEKSEGKFDPCLGRAIELWDVNHRHEPPGAEAVHRLAGRRLYRALEVDRWRGTPVARFTDPDVAVDLGGIAKGYAVDRAVQALREIGIERAFVNAGGDLYALGLSEDGDPWSVGIQSPSDPSRVERAFPLSDRAVATSGDYLQCFIHAGRRYHHILDPDSGEPRRTERHTISIVADRCLDADAAATAFFGAPEPRLGLRAVEPSADVV